MTPIGPIEALRDALAQELGPVAEIQLSPARNGNQFNLWVVAPNATDRVPEIIAAREDAVGELLNVVQVFDSVEDARANGVQLLLDAAARPDWRSRATGLPISAAPQPDPAFDAPLVVSFYSFRGGVGRSTALAHTAAVLAGRGRRVVIVDADLEAPGIHHAFGVRPHTARSRYPLVDLLRMVQEGVAPSDVDLREYLVRVPAFPDLYLLCAGDADAEYLSRLASLQITSWPLVENNPARLLIEGLAASQVEPHVVLIDARTGLTDTNAPFLLGASDHVVIVFYPSEQSAAGAALVSHALQAARGRRGAPVGIHFVASPVPAGKGESLDAAVVDRARAWATDWTSPLNDEPQEPDFVAVAYSPALALSDRLTRDSELLEPYSAIADWLDPVDDAVALTPDVTAKVRQELEFTAGNSDEPGEDIQRLFVRTDDAERLREQRILLVEGRKGTGKTTLFRWLLSEEPSVAVVTPESLRTQSWWPSGEAWKALAKIDANYSVSWSALIALRIIEETPAIASQLPRAVALLQRAQDAGVAGFVDVIQELSAEPSPALTALDHMTRAINALPSRHRILFDGLDTAFGYTHDVQASRDRALTSLLTLLLDREAALPEADFTVFVRTDIFRSLSFTNQSHLFGRSLTLSWEKSAYLRTVLKQALASSSTFQQQVGLPPSEVDDLTDDQTLRVWYELVGIRVRGKQTAFTDRWVWSRLADGNGDHSPRHIAQLFRVLADQARRRPQEVGPPIRARDFGAALSNVVSDQALTAVKDEFPSEVRQVLPIFEQLEQSPFSRAEWTRAGGETESLEMAETMGLVATHPREPDRLIVPELYRYALSVRRKGPA